MLNPGFKYINFIKNFDLYFALEGKGLKAAAKFVFNSYKVFQSIITYWKIEKVLINTPKKIFGKIRGSGSANILN